MKLSVIVPVYNEELTIGAVIEKIRAVDLGTIEKEIIIANDGSTDGTRRAIDEGPWCNEPNVRILHSPINLGKGAAVRLGLKYATGDVLLTQDADLELDPAEYMNLLGPIINDGAVVVYGSRFKRPNPAVSFRARSANRMLTMLANILFGGRLTDMETGYKAFRREVLQNVRLRCVEFDFEPEITAKLLLAGYKIVEVPIGYSPRRVDEGKKIRWFDGLDAVYTLLKCRLTHGR